MLSHKRETRPERQEPGLVVELCGLPGAGKSTLAGALIPELARHGHAVRAGASTIAPTVGATRRILVKASLALAETLAHPKFSAACVAAIARTRQPSFADLLRCSVQWIVTQRLLRSARREPGVRVVDEGVLQALWSIGLRGNPEPVLRTLASSQVWAGPDLVVVVAVPVEVVAERLASRGSRHARTQFLDPVGQRTELEYGERLLDRIVEWWRADNSAGGLARVGDDMGVAEIAACVVQLKPGAGPAGSPGRSG
ncbi:P-loop NTPase family protein [Kribbella swartbergensis]